jgi:hypothetical protein
VVDPDSGPFDPNDQTVFGSGSSHSISNAPPSNRGCRAGV